MAFFNYEALKDGKNRISGKIEANSEKEARELLRKQNLLPIKLNEIGAVKKLQKKMNTANMVVTKKKKIQDLTNREKIDFTNIMYTFSKAGIALVESLYFIETNSENPKIRIVATEIRRRILSGSSLSDALTNFPKTFDDIYIGLVRAGEESGELEKTLKRISYLLVKQDRLKSKIISTLAYPVFVLLLASLVTLLMLTFVFPAFKGMYDQMGADLPLITKILMAAGLFLKANWYVIPLIFLSFGTFMYYIFTWEISKRFIDHLGLKIPVFEKFLRFTSISNFVMIMRVAFEAGIPLVDSLLLGNYTVKNIVLREALKKATVQVQYGASLSSALRNANVFPGLVMCMIATGEEAGSLTDMLEQTGEYIDEQIDRVVELLSKLFEPLLFVIIGGIVLVLGLSLYLPLFQAYANMG